MRFSCENCDEVIDTEDTSLELNEYGWVVCPKCGTSNEPPEDECVARPLEAHVA